MEQNTCYFLILKEEGNFGYYQGASSNVIFVICQTLSHLRSLKRLYFLSAHARKHRGNKPLRVFKGFGPEEGTFCLTDQFASTEIKITS